mgnify:CR=1 FL=1
MSRDTKTKVTPMKMRLLPILVSLVLPTMALGAGPIYWDWPADRSFDELELSGAAIDEAGHLAAGLAFLLVGAGLQSSGAVEMLVGWVAPWLQGLPNWALILAVYLIAGVLTELVSNNAVAVIMTPVATGLAQTMGVDARPLVVAVMFAASAAFATPIGYQTNTLVYGPGGYRFSDFLRVGVPLNILMAITVTCIVPLIWPL